MRRIRFGRNDLPQAHGLVADAPVGETIEQAAKRHLDALFGAAGIPSMSLSADDPTAAPELEHDATSVQKLTNTTHVSYAQRFHSLPVYGARLGVELSGNHDLVGIDGDLGEIGDLDTHASLSPGEAR